MAIENVTSVTSDTRISLREESIGEKKKKEGGSPLPGNT